MTGMTAFFIDQPKRPCDIETDHGAVDELLLRIRPHADDLWGGRVVARLNIAAPMVTIIDIQLKSLMYFTSS